jgi:hypothetical protein
MAILTHAPHTMSVKAGYNKYDPVHNSIFEVAFAFPKFIGSNEENTALLTEQVTNVSGLDGLNKTPAAGSQKFFGADVSYLNPVHDNTYADITIEFNMNLKNAVDNYVLTTFLKWRNLNYNLGNGQRFLKKDYSDATITINIANRDGSVWRTVILYDVMLTGITNFDTLDITANEPVKLSCTFRSDYWDDSLGATDTATGPMYYDGTYPANTDSENLKDGFSVKANTNSVNR